MTVDTYGDADATALAELVRRGEATPTELLDEALARTAVVNPKLNAVIHLMEDPARAAIAAGLPDGPFRGVPFLLKDLVTAYAGEPMRFGSRLFRNFVPARDEELTRRYKAAGLVIFGKTNVPEFGMTNVTEPELFGPTRNPWNLDRTPGGSSGGSAAAVAARIVPMASGNDGGGSIRTPASNCGLVGLKPTRGRNPSGPQFADQWWGFIVEHVLTRTVRDCAGMLDATAGDYAAQLTRLPPPARPYAEEIRRDPGRLRVAYSRDPGLADALHPDNVMALERTCIELERLGHHLDEVRLPVERASFTDAFACLVSAEAANIVAAGERLLGRHATSQDLELGTRVLRKFGDSLSAGATAEAYASMQLFARRWLEWSAGFDVLVTPAVGLPPLPIGAYRLAPSQQRAIGFFTALPRAAFLRQRGRIVEAFKPTFDAAPFTMFANVTGQPSMSLPLHWTADGLPMGMLFTAALGDEATLFRLAAQLEHAMPWRSRRAPHAAA